MNLNYKELLPPEFAGDSRVWIYQCNRLLTMSEVLSVGDMLDEFVQDWRSHGTPVTGFATVFFGQFIVLMADETASGVSGCSTDSSVRLIKQIEKQFVVTLFDRQILAFVVKDKIQLLPMSQLSHALGNDFITAGTLYFNNTVRNKIELENDWIIPLAKSWLAKKINLQKGNSFSN